MADLQRTRQETVPDSMHPAVLLGQLVPKVHSPFGELPKAAQTCLICQNKICQGKISQGKICQDKICEDKSTTAAALVRRAPVEKRT